MTLILTCRNWQVGASLDTNQSIIIDHCLEHIHFTGYLEDGEILGSVRVLTFITNTEGQRWSSFRGFRGIQRIAVSFSLSDVTEEIQDCRFLFLSQYIFQHISINVIHTRWDLFREARICFSFRILKNTVVSYIVSSSRLRQSGNISQSLMLAAFLSDANSLM